MRFLHGAYVNSNPFLFAAIFKKILITEKRNSILISWGELCAIFSRWERFPLHELSMINEKAWKKSEKILLIVNARINFIYE